MSVIEHVGSGKEYGLRHHIVVVRYKKTALTGIHVLVSLGTVTPDFTEGAAGTTVPAGTHRMGTVLDEQ